MNSNDPRQPRPSKRPYHNDRYSRPPRLRYGGLGAYMGILWAVWLGVRKAAAWMAGRFR